MTKKSTPQRTSTPKQPLLNEQGIITCVDPNYLLTCDGIRNALMLSVLAAYDRGVEREFFADMLSQAMDGTEVVTRLQTVAKLHACMVQRAEREPSPMMTEAIDGVVAQVGRIRGNVKALMELVAQCPTPDDPIC